MVGTDVSGPSPQSCIVLFYIYMLRLTLRNSGFMGSLDDVKERLYDSWQKPQNGIPLGTPESPWISHIVRLGSVWKVCDAFSMVSSQWWALILGGYMENFYNWKFMSTPGWRGRGGTSSKYVYQETSTCPCPQYMYIKRTVCSQHMTCDCARFRGLGVDGRSRCFRSHSAELYSSVL